MDKKEQLSRNNIFCGSRERKVKKHFVNKDALAKISSSERCSGLLRFSFAQIVEFTENFKLENLIGRGGFGCVYKGKLQNGVEVAVKRLKASSLQGSKEFTAEIEMIANLQHKNVIRLLGFCIQREKDFLGCHIQGDEMILIYEYMPNKSLASFLHNYTEAEETIDWSKRLRIIQGIAQGLVYLHENFHQCVVHMDLKPSNVMLDYEMNPKISDFGLAKILSSSESEQTTYTIQGTYGYVAPEYAMFGKFSVKSDVYSFGVMILEIISRKKHRPSLSLPSGEMCDPSLVTCASMLWEAGKPHLLIDLSLCNDQQITQIIIRYIHVALLCVQHCPMDRPTMLDVLLMLRSESVSLPVPKIPGKKHASKYEDSMRALEEELSGGELTITALLGR